MKPFYSRFARSGFVCALLVLLAACAGDDSSAPQSANSALVLTLSSPARLADVDADIFLVTDYATGAIHRLDKTTLRTHKSIKMSGQATGIAWASSSYFVGNKSTRSVDVLDNQGRFLYHLGGRPGEFASVNDLAVVDGLVYVLDTKSAEVRLFYSDGTDTGAAIGNGVLKRPTALTIDPDNGNLLVSDFGDPASSILPAVHIFDLTGNHLGVISGAYKSGFAGTDSDKIFSTPQGLFVDAGHLYVVDALAGEVHIYRLADKAWIKKLGSLGTGDGQLRYPLDVLVDAASKDVFVADNGNCRITVFRAGAVLP